MRERDSNADSDPLKDKTPAEVAGTRLSTMTAYIELADQWYRSDGTQGSREDAYQLPGFVLEAVTVLPEEVVLMLGSWVKDALGIGYADPLQVGWLWVEDAKSTAWRLLMEHGQFPEHHSVLRESLDTTE